MNKNKTAVCTVFEGHYHKGVVVLINSLYANGFEGTIWAGIKGELPPWAKISSKENEIEIMQITDNLSIKFLHFAKNDYLPWIKPEFICDILDKYEPEAERIIYLDCDIIVKCPFSYFEKWSTFGIMLCEDVNSPISITNPLRYEWVEYFKKFGVTVRRDTDQYVNGGFIGLDRKYKGFLTAWRHIQDLVLQDLNAIKIDLHNITKVSDKVSGLNDRNYMFYRTDQDALNVSKDSTDFPLAVADRNAMDFASIGFIMSHAIGTSKPWVKNFLYYVVKKGQRPKTTDRIFFDYIDTPLKLYSNREKFLKKTHLKLATALGRVFG